MAETLAASGDLVERFRAAPAEARISMLAAALSETRDSFRCILPAAATRSIDEAAFIEGVQRVLIQDAGNLPALRLLSWHQIRNGDFETAKTTLRSFIESWPKLPDIRRELLRISILSPGADHATIFDLAGTELHGPLARTAYFCQHLLAMDEPVPAPKARELTLLIDHSFADILRGAAAADEHLPEPSAPVFLTALTNLLAAKSIALVANGPSLNGAKLGRAIDAHDLVVRCNFPKISAFSADVGTKVDLVIFNESLVASLPGLIANEASYRDCLALAFHPEPRALFAPEVYAANMTSRISRIQPKLRDFYRAFFYTRPTTGMMGVVLIAALLGKPVSLFGLDFYNAQTTHYYPSSAPVFLGHELQYENWFLKKFLGWVAPGKILNGACS